MDVEFTQKAVQSFVPKALRDTAMSYQLRQQLFGGLVKVQRTDDSTVWYVKAHVADQMVKDGQAVMLDAKAAHAVEDDAAGNGAPRLTCRGSECGEATVVRQPWMSDLQWSHQMALFYRLHPTVDNSVEGALS